MRAREEILEIRKYVKYASAVFLGRIELEYVKKPPGRITSTLFQRISRNSEERKIPSRRLWIPAEFYDFAIAFINIIPIDAVR